MRPLLFALSLAVALGACTSADDVPADADAPPAAGPQPAPSPVPDSLLGGVEVDDDPVTLVQLTPGDHACYMTVRDGEGTREKLADFNLCERDDLIGYEVLLTTAPSMIPAESCQGDPECRDLRPVRLVMAADRVDGIVSP